MQLDADCWRSDYGHDCSRQAMFVVYLRFNGACKNQHLPFTHLPLFSSSALHVLSKAHEPIRQLVKSSVDHVGSLRTYRYAWNLSKVLGQRTTCIEHHELH